MTYGKIYEEFLSKCNCADDIEDFRPCHEMYGVPTISYAIVVWFKDKSKIIYISDKAREFYISDKATDIAREFYISDIGKRI